MELSEKLNLKNETQNTPSPQNIIDAINHCSKNGFFSLINLIKETTILEKHDEIIEAWNNAKKRHRERDHGVTKSIIIQKQTTT